jgi:HD-GYP domain-containing protein (c-di-GMP phosphodiesterase class II)
MRSEEGGGGATGALGARLLKLAPEADRAEGYAEPHAARLAQLAVALGDRCGLRGIDRVALELAALAHDLGERAMKRQYLLRPDALDWEERLDLWRHPILGEKAAAQFGLPRQAQLFVRWHHEWWNGQGYPDMLAGDAIPLGARILRAGDLWCALVSARPWRDAYDEARAEEIFADSAGLECDPRLVAALLEIVAEERESRRAETPAPGYWQPPAEAPVWPPSTLSPGAPPELIAVPDSETDIFPSPAVHLGEDGPREDEGPENEGERWRI